MNTRSGTCRIDCASDGVRKMPPSSTSPLTGAAPCSGTNWKTPCAARCNTRHGRSCSADTTAIGVASTPTSDITAQPRDASNAVTSLASASAPARLGNRESATIGLPTTSAVGPGARSGLSRPPSTRSWRIIPLSTAIGRLPLSYLFSSSSQGSAAAWASSTSASRWRSGAYGLNSLGINSSNSVDPSPGAFAVVPCASATKPSTSARCIGCSAACARLMCVSASNCSPPSAAESRSVGAF